MDPTLPHQQQALPVHRSSPKSCPATAQQVLFAEIVLSHRKMNGWVWVQKQWSSHFMTSWGTQMKSNYQSRRLQLRLLAWGIEMSPWKSPSSAIHRRRVQSGGWCSRLTEPRCKLTASPCTPHLYDGDAGPCSPLRPQPYSQFLLHSLHLLPARCLCPACAASFAGSCSPSATCSQQGGDEASHVPLSRLPTHGVHITQHRDS